MSRVLYITRTSLLEPLGQSQVLAYLRGLASAWPITVISIEPADLAEQTSFSVLAEACAVAGIRWIPLPILASGRRRAVAELLALWRASRTEAISGSVELVHARSYLPALVALRLRRRLGIPFLFDMRALWLEERIAAGRLRRGSLIHQLLVRGERTCLEDASAVVSLTHAALKHLEALYPRAMKNQNVAVIPTCTDLDLFVPRPQGPESPPIYGCLGTVLSAWHRTRWLAAFFCALSEREHLARFEIVSRDDPAEVRAALDLPPSVDARLEIFAADRMDVPRIVGRHAASFLLYSQGLDRLGCSPTRLGELLACGVPVVASAGTGDVSDLLAGRNVGVVVEDSRSNSVDSALESLARLRADPETPARCRAVAEELFDLTRGTAAYALLYEKILNGSSRHASGRSGHLLDASRAC